MSSYEDTLKGDEHTMPEGPIGGNVVQSNPGL